jgi:iron complex transport system ATP-binding protein
MVGGVAAAVTMRAAGVTRGGSTLLRDVDWTVEAGEHWVVLGPNGAGKTSLLQLAGAVWQPSLGEVSVLGGRLGGVDVRTLRESIGMVDARTARALRGRRPGLEVVLTGAFGSIALQRARVTDAHRARATRLLEVVGGEALAQRAFDDCSQGERQRLLLARALMARPRLLLLDEPATGLDLPSRERLLRALEAAAAEQPDRPTATITHHLEEVPRTTTHALLLRDGGVLAGGPVDEVLTSEAVSACFGLRVAVARTGGRWTARLA